MATSAPPDTALVSCEDCFFRRELLCALPGNTVCPTFRVAGPNPALHAVAAPAPKPVAAAAAA